MVSHTHILPQPTLAHMLTPADTHIHIHLLFITFAHNHTVPNTHTYTCSHTLQFTLTSAHTHNFTCSHAFTHSHGSWTPGAVLLAMSSPTWEQPSRSYFLLPSPHLIIGLSPSQLRSRLASPRKVPQFSPACWGLPIKLTATYFSARVQQPMFAEHLLYAKCAGSCGFLHWMERSFGGQSGGARAHGSYSKCLC